MTTPDVVALQAAPEVPVVATRVEWVPDSMGMGWIDYYEAGDEPPNKWDDENPDSVEPLVRQSDHLAALRAAEQRAEAAEADAARYRWLKNFANFARVDAMLNTTGLNTLDAAVTAALKQGEQPCEPL